jgi:hypothetical protein
MRSIDDDTKRGAPSKKIQSPAKYSVSTIITVVRSSRVRIFSGYDDAVRVLVDCRPVPVVWMHAVVNQFNRMTLSTSDLNLPSSVS